MFINKLLLPMFAALFLLGACCQQNDSQPAEAVLPAKAVYLIAPLNGQNVKSPFAVKFGLKGMGVAPAGVQNENTGHHHLLIDLEQLPDLTTSLPSTEQLLLGDFAHRPHAQPLLSERITIQVVE